MSYNGTGTFNINTAGQPVVTGTTITSTAFNLLTADLATGLTTALTKDGQTTPTANIPMGSFKITGLGAGTSATDAAQYGQLQAGATTIATVTGTDTLTGSVTPALAAYATGNLFSFVAASTNTGAATINLNSLGAKSITKQGTTALIAGDIASGRVHLIEYDGTRFQLLNPASSTGTGASVFATSPTLVTPTLGVATATSLQGIIGNVTPAAGAFTTVDASGAITLSGGTANGVTYLNGSKVLTSGSALTFDGTNLGVGTSSPTHRLDLLKASGSGDVGTWALNGGATGYLYAGGSLVGIFDAASSGGNGVIIGGASVAIRFQGGGNEYGRFDSSGNLGIGTSSPGAKLDVSSSASRILNLNSTSANGYGMAFNNSGTDVAYIGSAKWNFSGALNDMSITTAGAYNLCFGTNTTERGRFDSSGNFMVGQTTTGLQASRSFSWQGTGETTFYVNHSTANTSGDSYMQFGYNGTKIGSITQSGTTAVLYNLTSDQRLKDNIQDANSASTLIDAIQVRQYNWKSDGSHQRYGFIAQELVTVAPEAVHQPKDTDEMMAVDYSKLVPMLVKEIQSLRVRVAQLETN